MLGGIKEHSMRDLGKSFGLAMMPGLVTGVGRADLIDTTPSWNGSQAVGNFGSTNVATYGQTITTPSGPGTVLNGFTFHINDHGLPLQFIGYVYEWNSTTGAAEGPALYTSSIVSLVSRPDYQTVSFNTGGINLTPGDQYVLFGSVSAPSVYGLSSSSSTWGLVNNAYTGGQFVYLNNFNRTSDWTTTHWNSGASSYDLAFSANFGTPVALAPEPSSLTAVIPVILLALGYSWIRRERANQGQSPELPAICS